MNTALQCLPEAQSIRLPLCSGSTLKGFYFGHTMKRCKRCGEVKPEAEFYLNSGMASGRVNFCKNCVRAYRQSRKEENQAYMQTYRQTHKEELLAKTHSYREKHPEKVRVWKRSYRENHLEERRTYDRSYNETRREETRAYNRAYNEKHREELREWHRAYREKHREERRAYNRAYNRAYLKAHPENHRASEHQRRARKANVKGERIDDRLVFQAAGYRCAMCGRKTRPGYRPTHSLYPNLDHIVPLARGGGHTWLNVQCLCRQCNVRKHTSVDGQQLRLLA